MKRVSLQVPPETLTKAGENTKKALARTETMWLGTQVLDGFSKNVATEGFYAVEAPRAIAPGTVAVRLYEAETDTCVGEVRRSRHKVVLGKTDFEIILGLLVTPVSGEPAVLLPEHQFRASTHRPLIEYRHAHLTEASDAGIEQKADPRVDLAVDHTVPMVLVNAIISASYAALDDQAAVTLQ